MRNTAKAIAFAALFGTCTLALAAGQFRANLTGAQEVPPNSSLATGDVHAKLDNDGKSLRVMLKFTGLGSNFTAAHIHTGAAGTNGPPIVTFDGLPTATSGSLQNFAATLTDVQAADLAAGRLYINVHSTGYPDGEIRGQLVAHPDNSVNAGEEATDAPTAKDEATEAYGEEEEK